MTDRDYKNAENSLHLTPGKLCANKHDEFANLTVYVHCSAKISTIVGQTAVEIRIDRCIAIHGRGLCHTYHDGLHVVSQY